MRCLLVLIVLFAAGLSSLRAATPIDDPTALLQAPAAWTVAESEQLRAFEAKSGIRILVEYHPKSPSDDEDRVDGAYMTARSTRLGTVEHGVLMVYFADDGSWRVWIGNALTPVFVGRAGDAKQFTESGQMHQTKEAYLEGAKARASARFAVLHPNLPLTADATRTPEYLRLWTEELIKGLEEKLAAVRPTEK